jgi:hypothetical protein
MWEYLIVDIYNGASWNETEHQWVAGHQSPMCGWHDSEGGSGQLEMRGYDLAEPLGEFLGQLGSDYWELVSCAMLDEHNNKQRFIFKRSAE